MKIGILFSVEKEVGGVYQYGLSFLDALKIIPEHQFIICNQSTSLPQKYKSDFKTTDLLNTQKHKSQLNIFENYIRKLLIFLRANIVLDLFFKLKNKKTIQLLTKENFDLLISFSESPIVFELNLPYINAIHDLQHKLNPQFPEVSKYGIWNHREHFFNKLCKTSSKILVDSEIGKEDVKNCYQVEDKKIIVLPFLPPNYLNEDITPNQLQEIKTKYNLPEKFLFYPAQFWPHKNHISIVKAIKILKDQNIIVNVVFCGSDKKQWGELKKIKQYIKNNSLEKQVFFLGYVPNEAMSALYKSAVALIMPTFFGPTNIPVLEAWKMSCPVLYSDIRGCREQLGNAGLLINPEDPRDISEKINLIWNDKALRQDLIQKGTQRLGEWTYSDFSNKVSEIFKNI